MPLEGDWQLPELARSVTLPILRWPNNRLQRTTLRAAAEPERWAQLAQSSHFYDQSHFNKDFMAFTGDSPGDYLRRRRRFQAENPEQARNLGQMPVD